MPSNIVFAQNSKGEAKQRMNGDAADIQRGNSGWCANSDVLLGVFNQIAKQSGFSSSSATGNENVVLRLLDVVKEVLLLY
jgi:hypothetical protein